MFSNLPVGICNRLIRRLLGDFYSGAALTAVSICKQNTLAKLLSVSISKYLNVNVEINKRVWQQ